MSFSSGTPYRTDNFTLSSATGILGLHDERGGHAIVDILAGKDEKHPVQPLLQPVMKQGACLLARPIDIDATRQHAAAQIARLPERIRDLVPTKPPYPVRISKKVQTRQQKLVARLSR